MFLRGPRLNLKFVRGQNDNEKIFNRMLDYLCQSHPPSLLLMLGMRMVCIIATAKE